MNIEREIIQPAINVNDLLRWLRRAGAVQVERQPIRGHAGLVAWRVRFAGPRKRVNVNTRGQR